MNRFVCGLLLCFLLVGQVFACAVVVQSISSTVAKITTPLPVDDAELLHAYSSSNLFSPRGATVTWTAPVQDGDGVWHSYAVGPYVHNPNGSITVQGSQGRTPPALAWTLDVIAP